MKYSLEKDIAFISIDDGKANAANFQFVHDMTALLNRASTEAKALVVYGRPGMFSAGFDLKTLPRSPREAQALASQGMALLTRIYAHPQPVIVGCDGHAIGLGAFILLAADVRLGSATEYKIRLPETAQGWGFNPVLMTLIRDRIASNQQTAAVLQSRPYSAQEAVAAGFLDAVVERDSLLADCRIRAEQLSQLPGEAYASNKESLRSHSLKTMREYTP